MSEYVKIKKEDLHDLIVSKHLLESHIDRNYEFPTDGQIEKQIQSFFVAEDPTPIEKLKKALVAEGYKQKADGSITTESERWVVCEEDIVSFIYDYHTPGGLRAIADYMEKGGKR